MSLRCGARIRQAGFPSQPSAREPPQHTHSSHSPGCPRSFPTGYISQAVLSSQAHVQEGFQPHNEDAAASAQTPESTGDCFSCKAVELLGCPVLVSVQSGPDPALTVCLCWMVQASAPPVHTKLPLSFHQASPCSYSQGSRTPMFASSSNSSHTAGITGLPAPLLLGQQRTDRAANAGT